MVFITDFPDEILEQILFKLSPYEDLNNCAVVCRRWSHIVHSVRRLTTMNLLKGLADTRTLRWQPNHDSESRPPASSNHQARASASVPVMPGIAARFSHAAVVHDNAMYVFGGGSSSSTTFNDLWRFDLSRRQWHRPQSTGSYPTPKACASIAVHGDRLVVFGGWRHPSASQLHESWQLFNELHVYDIAERKWTLHTSGAHAPPPMTGHSATVHGDRMVVFGGFQQQQQNAANRFAAAGIFHDDDEDDGQLTGSSNSVWCMDLVTYTWQEMRTSALKPPPRYGQYQVRLDDDRLLVMGGCGGPNNMFNDAWVLRMVGAQWQWHTVRIGNRKWTATYMWCNPACRIGSKLILLGPATSVPSDLHLMKPTVMVRDNNDAQNHQQHRPNAAQHNNHNNHHHHHPNQNPPNGPQQRQPQPAAPPIVVAPVVALPRTPIQICEEANRRLQIERNKRPQPATSSSSAQRNRPGPSSGVLVRRTAADRPHEDDEEAVNRRLKRNLQLKSRDDDLEQFLPKRFNQPHPEPLGMSAFSGSSNSSSDHHSPQQQNRLQSLRRMEEKIRSIQNHVAGDVAAPAVLLVPEQPEQQIAPDLPVEEVLPPIVDNPPVALAQQSETNGQAPRAKRDCIGVFVCDISGLLSATPDETAEQGATAAAPADKMVLNWVQSHNGGLIAGAPERLILSSLVAGNGELIMFGGLRKESLTNVATTTQVSNSVHFLSFKRDIL